MAILPEDIVRAIENATGHGDNFIDVNYVDTVQPKQETRTVYRISVTHTSVGVSDDKIIIQLLSETPTTIERGIKCWSDNLIFEAVVKDLRCVLIRLKDEIKANDSPTDAIQFMSDFAACSYAAGKIIAQSVTAEILPIISKSSAKATPEMLKKLRLTITTKILNAGKIKGKTQDEFFTRLNECIAELKNSLIALAEDGNSPSKENTPTIAIVAAPFTPYKGKEFEMIRQGVATNELAKFVITAHNRGAIIPDPMSATNDGTMVRGNTIVRFSNYNKLSDPTTSTYQLFDALIVKFTETGQKTQEITLSLSEYMDRRGLKNRQKAKEQVVDDIDILRNTSISWEEKRGKATKRYEFMNLAEKGSVDDDGEIRFVISISFLAILLACPVMPYSTLHQQLNGRRNPNSYEFLRSISVHKNMNIGKANEDIISVKTLLAAAPAIPTYEQVMKSKSKHVQRKIIEPFERDMDALGHVLQWDYCHRKGESLPNNELPVTSYKAFEKLLIRITWNNYPDQTKRLQRKAEKIEEAKRKRKNITNTKNT